MPFKCLGSYAGLASPHESAYPLILLLDFRELPFEIEAGSSETRFRDP